MNPKQIKGTYTLRADLVEMTMNFLFTDSDRYKEIAPDNDFMLNLACADIDRPINNTISLISNNKLFVKKARILTLGAPGLSPSAISTLAAKILIVGRELDDINSDPVGGFSFGLSLYNEWQDLNIEFLPIKKNENYYLSIDSQYTKMWIDDYNLQSAYIGQPFRPVLEMIVDTSGVIDNGGNIV